MRRILESQPEQGEKAQHAPAQDTARSHETTVYEWEGELRAHWSISQPSSSSGAERQQAAEDALTAEGRRMINTWNQAPIPQRFRFHSIRFLRHENSGSETHTDPWTGVRHHDAWGDGVGKLLYRLG